MGLTYDLRISVKARHQDLEKDLPMDCHRLQKNIRQHQLQLKRELICIKKTEFFLINHGQT